MSIRSIAIHNLESEVNHELKIVNNWMKFNQLSLNCSKSFYIIVTPHHKNNGSALNNFIVKVNALKIPSSLSAKYLGIIIDKSLKWHDHFLAINSLNTSWALSKVKHFIPKTTLINLHYSFVYPHKKYKIVAWGGTNSTLIHQLKTIQKFIRLINFKCLKDHVKMTTLYKSMNILKISDIYELEVAKFIHFYN